MEIISEISELCNSDKSGSEIGFYGNGLDGKINDMKMEVPSGLADKVNRTQLFSLQFNFLQNLNHKLLI